MTVLQRRVLTLADVASRFLMAYSTIWCQLILSVYPLVLAIVPKIY